MIVYINTDGTISSVEPKTLTQGSNNTSSIVLICPAISQFSTVEIDFKLPNKEVINGGFMLPADQLSANGLLNAYTYTVTNAITNLAGILGISFKISNVNGTVSSYLLEVDVIISLTPSLPEAPSIDVYEEIRDAYAYLSGMFGDIEEVSAQALEKAIEALEVAEQAEENSDTALSNSQTALSNSTSALETSQGALEIAESAESIAEQAEINSETAIETANEAKEESETAVETSEDALLEAETAKDVALGIEEKADSAISTANSALGVATGIDSKATQALANSLEALQDINLKQDRKPDGNNELIVNNKINTVYIPDIVLGQLVYGGTFNSNSYIATLTDNAKLKLGTTVDSITLTNDSSIITGYKDNEGIYYITSNAGTFAGIGFEVGDWLISSGSGWTKIDNTDAVVSVNGKTGTVVISKSDVSLGNVDNTSDMNKPISTDTQIALDLKQDAISGTGFVKASGTTISYDNTTYLAANTMAGENTLGSVKASTKTEAETQEVKIDTLTGRLYTASAKEITVNDIEPDEDNNIELTTDDITEGDNKFVTELEKESWDDKIDQSNISTEFSEVLSDSKVISEKLAKDTFDTKEDNLPQAPEDTDNIYLGLDALGNKVWKLVSAGSSGYSSNIYLSNDNSDIEGYKKLKSIIDEAETEFTKTANNAEKLMETFLFDSAIGVNIIDAGTWSANIYCKVSETGNVTRFKLEPFLYHTDGTETDLFIAYSPDVNNTSYGYITANYNMSTIECSPTDRIGVRVSMVTTRTSPTSLFFKTGNGYATYVNVPLALRHIQLRQPNEDPSTQHITTVEKTNLNNAILKTEMTLTAEEKTQVRTNIGAGTSSFSGSYNDLSDQPTIPTNSSFTLSGLSEKSYNNLTDKPDLTLKLDKKPDGTNNLIDSNNKIDNKYISDSILGQVEYKGTWNATTNEPELDATPEEKGHYYVVNTGGTRFSLTFAVGDWIISNGTSWEKVDNTDAVSSVAGKTGVVVLTSTDVGLGNVDNTSDADKPISDDTQEALDEKADKSTTLSGYGITDAVSANSAITAQTTAKLVTYDSKGLVTGYLDQAQTPSSTAGYLLTASGTAGIYGTPVDPSSFATEEDIQDIIDTIVGV